VVTTKEYQNSPTRAQNSIQFNSHAFFVLNDVNPKVKKIEAVLGSQDMYLLSPSNVGSLCSRVVSIDVR
jgi:hypothetical protein